MRLLGRHNISLWRITLGLAAFFATAALYGCFTGIESTPKITVRDVDRSVDHRGAEVDIARLISPQPLSEWGSGHRLLVVDSRLSRVLDFQPAVDPGDTLTLIGRHRRLSLTGDSLDVLTFATSAGRSVTFAGEVAESVPFTVDLQLVELADSILRGLQCYVTTPLRVDVLGKPIANGPKYVPVTISAVVPGNDIYPLIAEISYADGNTDRLAMTAGSSLASTRNFDTIFCIDNPRQRFPDIVDSVWNLITASRVAEGMTTDECRLAVGSPRDIRRWQNGGAWFERWTFDNGSYLVFQDGHLTDSRL